MRIRFALWMAAVGVGFGSTPAWAQSECTEQKLEEVYAEADEASQEVTIDCDLALEGDLTKRLRFCGAAASGVTLSCNGFKIDPTFQSANGAVLIRSGSDDCGGQAEEDTRPEDVTIRGCQIYGKVLIVGMQDTQMIELAKELSGELGPADAEAEYVRLVRAAAPQRAFFERVTIIGSKNDANLFHLRQGVNHVQLIDSEIKGRVQGVNIYLSPETSRNVFRNNYIHASTQNNRELMALDGSSQNLIVGNRFSALQDGGIYLFRNCGERGTTRVSMPNYNQIMSNFFYYDSHHEDDPAVLLGWMNPTDHCEGDEDNGIFFGSAVSDTQYVQHNVVMQNQINKRDWSEAIAKGTIVTDLPNFIDFNETVERAGVPASIGRRAGCFVVDGPWGDASVRRGYPHFIPDGEATVFFQDENGDPVCPGLIAACDDGVLQLGGTSDEPCPVAMPLDCRIEGDNLGCDTTVQCPAETTAIGAKAACNLEFGAVSATELAEVPGDFLRVVTESDTRWAGRCFVGTTSLGRFRRPSGNTFFAAAVRALFADPGLALGESLVTGVIGSDRVDANCYEQDKNGGDCHVAGTVYCRGSRVPIPD